MLDRLYCGFHFYYWIYHLRLVDEVKIFVYLQARLRKWIMMSEKEEWIQFILVPSYSHTFYTPGSTLCRVWLLRYSPGILSGKLHQTCRPYCILLSPPCSPSVAPVTASLIFFLQSLHLSSLCASASRDAQKQPEITCPIVWA